MHVHIVPLLAFLHVYVCLYVCNQSNQIKSNQIKAKGRVSLSYLLRMQACNFTLSCTRLPTGNFSLGDITSTYKLILSFINKKKPLANIACSYPKHFYKPQSQLKQLTVKQQIV